VDGDANSYWESTDNAFPQTFTVDLGATTQIGTLVLRLPPTWVPRTQTLAVQGSTDGVTYTTLVDSANYTFDPASGNTSTIRVLNGTARYVRLEFTANTGWPAGQISELDVYGR
jgi:hypothetical protein